MAEVLAGTVFLSVNGIQLDMVGDGSYSCSTMKRESLNGADGFHGFKETPRSPFIAAKVRNRGALSMSAIQQMRDVTVQMRLSNGKLIIGRNMGEVSDQIVETNEATVDLRFEGPEVFEQ